MHLKKTILFTLLPAALLCSASLAEESRKEAKASKRATGKKSMSNSTWSGKRSSFHGYELVDFKLGEVPCKVVIPKKIADGKPWVLRARFWGHQPQFDIAMLKAGHHIVYCDVGNLFGSPEAVRRWDELYNYLRFEHLFADRAILEGLSRGGLIIYNWAAANADKVAAIYGDAPVMDFKSWPGGKGTGKGDGKSWKACLEAYGMTEAEALAYQGNPLDNLAPLAKAGIPIIHVVGDADEVVPVAENTAIAEARYQKLGGTFKVIHKPGVGHKHSLKDPQPIVDFILAQDKGVAELPAEKIISDKNFTLRGDYQNSRIQFEQNKRGHVAFIGGSITEMDGYRPMVCKILKKRFPDTEFKFTAAGISSTCSDTGAFRMQRDVLSKGPLDMLFVEFAVNDDQDSDQAYHDALRGMEGIIAQARKHNPKVDIVMTMFVNENILEKLQKGEITDSVKAHSKVAEHYNISVNHLAQELAELITAGKMNWKKFGGVHPNQYGNTMCATMIANALLPEWQKPLAVDAVAKDHPAVPLLDPKSYSRGRLLPFSDINTDEHWKKDVPNWPKENKGKVRGHFINTPMIYSSSAGAKLSIKFTGTAIGAYMLSGPDTAIVKVTVDGKQSKEIETLRKYSCFNYPMTVMFFNELEDGEHSLELEILPNQKGGKGRPGGGKLGGTALRVIGFTAN
jgi:lysophospholipase L1-like esterase